LPRDIALHEDGKFSYQENTMRVIPNNVLAAHMAAELQARSVARAEALAYAKEVANQCALAGQPERTSVFMRAETPIADVRKKLTGASAAGGDVAAARDVKPDAAKIKSTWGKAISAVNASSGFRK
jgi:hypothetical protein